MTAPPRVVPLPRGSQTFGAVTWADGTSLAVARSRPIHSFVPQFSQKGWTPTGAPHFGHLAD